ncbi:MAG: AI-2E family transporter [Clostridiales bacterium]|nr:AI-2E family transporter [Clostridiales bacterium]
MNRFKNALGRRWGAYSVAAVTGVVAYLVLTNMPVVLAWLSHVVQLMSPIIIGIIIAYLIDLIVVFFENKIFKKVKKPKTRYILSVTVSILLVLIFIGFFFWLVLPEIVQSITHFISNAQNYSSLLDENLAKLDKFAAQYDIQLNATKWTSNIHAWTDTMIADFTTNLSRAMNTVLSVGSMLVNVFVGIILAVYFLAGKKKLYAGIRRFRHALLTDEQYEKHTAFLKRSSAIFAKYISYTILEAIGVGIVNAIFMLIAGLPNVTLISVLVAVTNILPTFGPIIGGALGAFILLLEDPMYALIFIIFTLILQTIDGYIVKPHLFGDSLGMPSFVSLISIILGGKLFGPIGILISIPFAAVCAILYRESFLPWLNKRKQMRTPAPAQKKDK